MASYIEGRPTAEHWRNRAEEMRVLAAEMSDHDGKDALEGVALMYDRMALNIERREAIIARGKATSSTS